MDSVQILQVIDKHNLTVRKIPEVVTSTFFFKERRSLGENQIVKTVTLEEEYPNATPSQMKRLKEMYPKGTRQVVVETKYPEHGGWYMCKAVNDTGSLVKWSKRDNLAPTLSESIEMFLNKRG